MECDLMKYVLIDAGHNQHIAGKRSPDSSLMEWEFNRDVGNRIVKLLSDRDIKARLLYTENADAKKDVNERVQKANESGADILVSIHANAHKPEWTSASGWEIFCYKLKGEGYKLAQAIHEASIPFLGIKDRGIKDGSHYGMVARTNMPAVLIEHGFYTNKEECELLKSDGFRDICAIADAKGICKYLGIPFDLEEEKEAVNEYRAAVKDRFGFEDSTLDYLEAYKYGADLLKKLATKG